MMYKWLQRGVQVGHCVIQHCSDTMSNVYCCMSVVKFITKYQKELPAKFYCQAGNVAIQKKPYFKKHIDFIVKIIIRLVVKELF